jgi:hypothetical protein
MKKTTLYVILFAACSLMQPTEADQILWDYSLTELPPGWEVFLGEWDFQPDGAHSDASAGFFEEDWNELRSPELVLPEGTDSIGIEAGQASESWTSGAAGTFAFARMVLTVNGQGFIVWNNSSGIDSLPIFVVPAGAAAGDTIRIDLLCVAISWPETVPRGGAGRQQQSYAIFHVWDFVLTAYGDVAALAPSTWGSVKTLSYPFRR